MNEPTAPPASTRVMLLFGGRSGEHSISCLTAGCILRAIDRSRFEPIPVGVTRDGRWTLAPDAPERLAMVDGRLPEVSGGGPEVVPPDRVGSREWRLVDPSGQITSLGHIDVVFPLFHGPFGEDGTIQGLLELTDQLYVGSGVLASAVGMDKEYMKAVLRHRSLPVAPYAVVTPSDWAREPGAVLNRAEALGFPLFVKPCRAGSSLGISKVGGVEELGDGILQAGEHDPRVLLEAAVPGREIECAVLGAVPPAPARASLPSEIVVRGGHEFYDFEAKYLDAAGAELRCPADLPPGVAGEVQAMACAAFSAIGAEGLARVDFFYDEAGPPGAQLIINEINTMPGFTPISQYPRMWQATGLEYTELLSELIDLTLARRVGLR